MCQNFDLTNDGSFSEKLFYDKMSEQNIILKRMNLHFRFQMCPTPIDLPYLIYSTNFKSNHCRLQPHLLNVTATTANPLIAFQMIYDGK